MASSTQSSEGQESQSNDQVMDLVQMLYKKREAMPMEAEPDEVDVELEE